MFKSVASNFHCRFLLDGPRLVRLHDVRAEPGAPHSPGAGLAPGGAGLRLRPLPRLLVLHGAAVRVAERLRDDGGDGERQHQGSVGRG